MFIRHTLYNYLNILNKDLYHGKDAQKTFQTYCGNLHLGIQLIWNENYSL